MYICIYLLMYVYELCQALRSARMEMQQSHERHVFVLSAKLCKCLLPVDTCHDPPSCPPSSRPGIAMIHRIPRRATNTRCQQFGTKTQQTRGTNGMTASAGSTKAKKSRGVWRLTDPRPTPIQMDWYPAKSALHLQATCAVNAAIENIKTLDWFQYE